MERKGFIIKNNFNNDFVELLDELKDKYGEDVFTVHGIGDRDLDMTKFPKDFYGKSSSIAHVSVDDNANVSEKTVTQYSHERFKSHAKLNSIYMMYKWVKKLFSKSDAKKAVENLISGKIFINDLTNFDFPYCYAFDLLKLAEDGLDFYKPISIKKPKRSETFIQLVIQATAYISNQIMGAVAYPSFFPILDWYYRRELGEDYIEKIKIGKTAINESYLNEKYLKVKEQFQTLIYSLNFPFRTGGQTSFTNLSILDKGFLNHLFKDYVLPDNSSVNINSSYELSKIFFEYFSDIQCNENVFTFPVITLAISLDSDNNYIDKDFVEWVAKANCEKSIGNIFQSTPSKFSSCCRLLNDFEQLAQNSFGVGGLSIGSLRVCGINMARLAIEEKKNNNELNDLLDCIHKILYSQRKIVQDRIERGVLPLYKTGWISDKKQFSTVGLLGCNEYLENKELDILDKQNREILLNIFKTIYNKTEEWKREELSEGNTYNIEVIPGESQAVKLAQIDKVLGHNSKYKLYSNQYVPLIKESSIYDRMTVQSDFDKYSSGGAIMHATYKESEPLSKEQYLRLILTAKDLGVAYFAINYSYTICDNGHKLVGDFNECPICKSGNVKKYQRVAGFITPVDAWNKVRKNWEYDRRVSYKREDI